MIRVNEKALSELQGRTNDTQFARKFGISRNQYWRIRHGRSGVGVDFIEGFMKAFPNLSLNDYFFTTCVALTAQNEVKDNRIEDDKVDFCSQNFFTHGVELKARIESGKDGGVSEVTSDE